MNYRPMRFVIALLAFVLCVQASDAASPDDVYKLGPDSEPHEGAP